MTAQSKHSSAIVELGKKLVEQLGGEETADVLSRWMAHYIAELIVDADSATPSKKAKKQEACAVAICRLWHHSSYLRNGHRPFEAYEPILRTLASLDPSDSSPRYSSVWRNEDRVIKGEAEARRWLDAIDGVDYTARLLIRQFLVQAASTALDKSQEWVKLAEEAGLDQDEAIRVVRFITTAHKEGVAPTADEILRKKLEERADLLKGFGALATALSQELRRQLSGTKKVAKRRAKKL